jgi:hypothetical protein
MQHSAAHSTGPTCALQLAGMQARAAALAEALSTELPETSVSEVSLPGSADDMPTTLAERAAAVHAAYDVEESGAPFFHSESLLGQLRSIAASRRGLLKSSRHMENQQHARTAALHSVAATVRVVRPAIVRRLRQMLSNDCCRVNLDMTPPISLPEVDIVLECIRCAGLLQPALPAPVCVLLGIGVWRTMGTALMHSMQHAHATVQECGGGCSQACGLS